MNENLSNHDLDLTQIQYQDTSTEPELIKNSVTDRKKSLNKKTFFILFGLFLFIGVFYLGYRFFNLRKVSDSSQLNIVQNSTKDDLVDRDETHPSPSFIDLTTNNLFYGLGSNIYSYDLVTEEKKELTNYPEEITSSADNISIIDAKTIGFSKCETKGGDFGCGVYTLDLEKNQIEERQKLDKDLLINKSSLDFASASKFAYVVNVGKEDDWGFDKYQLFLFDNGDLKLLENIDIEVYGRGGLIEDSSKISFSPDKKYLLHIDTGSPREVTGFDPNIYVYDLENNEKQIISEATQPEWLDDETIVYKKIETVINNEEDGLYLYNISSKNKEKIIGIDDRAYMPKVLAQSKKILYRVLPNQEIWLYDFNTKQNNKVLENSSNFQREFSRYILSFSWISPTKIIYAYIEPCDENEGCEELTPEYNPPLALFDLESKMEKNIVSFDSPYSFVVKSK
jgi:hypothetical protein